LAHSWSGNLVTNATWDDFWLNEGFTDYFERRIMEALEGKDYSDMLWDIGYQDLVDQVNDLGKNSRDTWLKADLKGRSTEDGFTDIPYEKGSHFLKLIENTVGREKWDAFLIKYFNEHAFKSINTVQFLIYLRANLIKGDSSIENKININAWVYGPGIPVNCPRVIPERFKVVDTVREKFLNGTLATQLSTTGWTTFEWLHFLRNLPAPLPIDKMEQLDNAFHFTTSGNSEIADLWYLMSIKADYKKAYPAMENFLSTIGREKFLQPLYGEMMKTGKQEMAKSLYAKYRMNYHPLAQASIDKIVK
jgi:leukotriene-A4 hydrolase